MTCTSFNGNTCKSQGNCDVIIEISLSCKRKNNNCNVKAASVSVCYSEVRSQSVQSLFCSVRRQFTAHPCTCEAKVSFRLARRTTRFAVLPSISWGTCPSLAQANKCSRTRSTMSWSASCCTWSIQTRTWSRYSHPSQAVWLFSPSHLILCVSFQTSPGV